MKRSIGVVATVLALSACQSWTPLEVSAPAYFAERSTDALRVTLGTSEQYVLRAPSATADSIQGDHDFGRLSFSHEQVALVEERRFSALKTAVIGGVALLGWGLFQGFFEGNRVN